MDLLPLADLEAFAAVAECRNFRKAAALRRVSPSQLSEAVRRLETRLEARLLNRTTRSVTPTEAGAMLLARVRPHLAGIEGALEQVAVTDGEPVGRLRLNVPTIVGRTILPDILVSFMARHPRITVEVESRDTFIDVFAEGFDAGVRYDESLDLDMVAVPLGPRTQRFVVAASPAYLERHALPEHPRDLLRLACIRHRFESGRLSGWEFERGGEIIRIDPRSVMVANALELEVAAAVGGIGVIATFEDTLAPYLASGALVELLPDWQQPFSGPYLYYPGTRLMPPPLRAFVDHLKQLARSAKVTASTEN